MILAKATLVKKEIVGLRGLPDHLVLQDLQLRWSDLGMALLCSSWPDPPDHRDCQGRMGLQDLLELMGSLWVQRGLELFNVWRFMLLRGCSLIFQGDPGEDGRAVSFSVFTLKYCYKRRIIYRLFQINRLKYYQCNLGFLLLFPGSSWAAGCSRNSRRSWCQRRKGALFKSSV